MGADLFSTNDATAYPWHSIECLSRQSVNAAQALRRRADWLGVANRIAEGLGKWSGRPARFELHRLYAATEEPAEPKPRLLIRCAVAPFTLLCCIDPRLCLAAAQALAKGPEQPLDPLPPVEAPLLGAVAALASYLVDEVGFPAPVRFGWGRLPEAIGMRVTAEGILRWGRGSYEVVTTCDWPWLPTQAPKPLPDWSRLGQLPLPRALIVGRVALSATEFSQLSPEAVLLPGGDLWIDAAGLGKAMLGTPDGEWGYPCELLGAGRIVLGPGAVNSDFDDATPSAGGLLAKTPAAGDKPHLGRHFEEVLASVPVVVRIEMGSVTLSAGDFAALRPGDIIETSNPIGEPVVLRVGGRAVAQGELVNIEGQLGVRICELFDGEGP